MRCIEILLIPYVVLRRMWLTLTWDVLKLKLWDMTANTFVRLTLTWDVLKFFLNVLNARGTTGLTLTWDVLKLSSICCRKWSIKD